MKSKIYFLVFFFFCIKNISAQKNGAVLSGRILYEDNSPCQMAVVLVKGTNHYAQVSEEFF